METNANQINIDGTEETGVHSLETIADSFDNFVAEAKKTIERYLVKPKEKTAGFKVTDSETDVLSERIYGILQSREFRQGPHKSEEYRQSVLDKIKYQLSESQPIDLLIFFGPQKNPNATDGQTADWAEVFALSNLIKMHNSIAEIYPLGANINIITSGYRAIQVNEVDPKRAEAYETSVKNLVNYLGYDSIITTGHLGALCAEMNSEFQKALGEVRPQAEEWWNDPNNVKEVEEMKAHARNDMDLKGHDDEEIVKEKISNAAFKYKLYRLAEKKVNILCQYSGSVHASYNRHDSSPIISVFTLKKGNITQPWQGEGVLVAERCHDELSPEVLTQRRKEAYVPLATISMDTINLNTNGLPLKEIKIYRKKECNGCKNQHQ